MLACYMHAMHAIHAMHAMHAIHAMHVMHAMHAIQAMHATSLAIAIFQINKHFPANTSPSLFIDTTY